MVTSSSLSSMKIPCSRSGSSTEETRVSRVTVPCSINCMMSAVGASLPTLAEWNGRSS